MTKNPENLGTGHVAPMDLVTDSLRIALERKLLGMGGDSVGAFDFPYLGFRNSTLAHRLSGCGRGRRQQENTNETAK
jgi:hypothetical protein